MNKLLIIAVLGAGLTVAGLTTDVKGDCGWCAKSKSSKGMMKGKTGHNGHCECKDCSHKYKKLMALGTCRDACVRCASVCSHCNKESLMCAIACMNLKLVVKQAHCEGKKVSEGTWKELKEKCLNSCKSCKKMCESKHKKYGECKACAKACSAVIEILSMPKKAKSTKMQPAMVASPAVAVS